MNAKPTGTSMWTNSSVEGQLKDAAGRHDWQKARNTLSAVAGALAGELSIPPDGSVFYTNGLKTEAMHWGRCNGKFTIDMTKPGVTLGRLTDLVQGRFRWVEDIRPAWAHLSEQMAKRASGEVNVFVKGQKGNLPKRPLGDFRSPVSPTGFERRAVVRGAGSVFWGVELPELKTLLANLNVTRITYHVMDFASREEIDTLIDPA